MYTFCHIMQLYKENELDILIDLKDVPLEIGE